MISHIRWIAAAAVLIVWNFSGAASVPPSAAAPIQPPGSKPFTQAEMRGFLEAVQKAEVIADPVQRCLAYPDPPGSHWSHLAVEAYCRNQLSTEFTFKSLTKEIESGDARRVDRRMARLLRKQLSRNGAPGVLDATYEFDFDNPSAKTRAVLNAWKRKSPHAYAYAASGIAYVAAASKARGSAWVDDTPQSKFDAMNALLAKARHDLDRAVALNKRLIPAYAAMIRLAGLNGDGEYAESAAQRALKVDPSDYLIYSRMIWLSQPKWGGSIDAMRSVIAESQHHVKENPLLVMLQNQADAVEAGLDDCGCGSSGTVNADVYRRIFDQAIAKSWLGGAGMNAADAGRNELAVIYLSEALRFTPSCNCSTDYLIARSNALVGLAQYAWAVSDADRALKEDPEAKRAWTARGLAHLISQDNADAEKDFRQALKLVPTDPYSLWDLGNIYLGEHRWNEAWELANQLIEKHPDDPNGWILRANIQQYQPRPGLHDTIVYFIDHFGSDPDQQSVVMRMRRMLQQEKRLH